MHIPDSVLSPATSAAAAVAMLPIWAAAGKHVRKNMGSRQIPLLAMGSAFCFTIMMFNIPALGGTTAHPVAGTLLAVLLGPWAAVIGVSVSLAIQALLFGDGGLMTYGANCFTMAFVLPFTGFALYRISHRLMGNSDRTRPIAAAVGSFFGINAAAGIVALLLGIQPSLFHEANGHALFFPLGISITLPAMLITHLLVAGPAEAVVTGLVVRYLQTMSIPLYGENHSAGDLPSRRTEKIWIGLLAMIALCPLGLLAKGEAWGEWDAKGLSEQIAKQGQQAYIPKSALASEAHGYKGIRGFQDYASEKGAKGYLTAGLLGTGMIVGLIWLAGRVLNKNERTHSSPSNSGEIEYQRSNMMSASPVLPEWMITCSHIEPLPKSVRKGTRNRFLENTLNELTNRHASSLRIEESAKRSGYLQRIEPQVKILISLIFIISISSVRNLPLLAAIYLLVLYSAVISHLPIKPLLKRVWAFVFLFAGAIILPSTLNVVTPGRELIVLWQQPRVSMTFPGTVVAATLMIKIAVALSLGMTLTLSTRWNSMLKGLAVLRIPTLFLTVLAMTHRYLSVIMQTAADMFTARQSRLVGPQSNSQGRSFIGAGAGALFGKSLALSEEIHQAMISRGFRGQFIQLD